MVAAGEALNPEVLRAWREATGLEIRDGYGQTETGQMTGVPLGRGAAAGLDGQGAAGREAGDRGGRAGRRSAPACRRSSSATSARASARAQDGELADRGPPRRRALAHRRPGQRRRRRLPALRGPQRRRDRLRRLPDRPVRGGVRAGRPPGRGRGGGGRRARRGAGRGRARRGGAARRARAPRPRLCSELQEHVKRETAPYKYPRIVEFAAELPKTASGKVSRALLRESA